MSLPKEDRATSESDQVETDLLVPGLVHELRQPLMAIGAAAELLERELGAAVGGVAWRMLRSQVARLGEILRSYESLSRPGAIAPGPFDVGPVVTRAVDLLAHRVRPLAQRFALDGAGRHRAFGAPDALVHAATNVIANAVDAVEARRGEGRVHVRVVGRPQGSIEIRVSDEGTGIPAEIRGSIFEPRFTTKPAGRGNGLGLHIARRLMTRFGGDVHLVVDGDPARLPWAVTEFCITLPAALAGVTT